MSARVDAFVVATPGLEPLVGGELEEQPRMTRRDQVVVDLVPLVEDVLVLLEREMMKHRVQVEREFAPVPRL